MLASYGNGGWVCIDDEDLPGPLYLRFSKDDTGRWRTRELYLEGRWRHLVGADFRELALADLEAVILDGEEHLAGRAETPGPDLSRLAAHLATTWGPGAYSGDHCKGCGAPTNRRGRALRDWVALSWFAQYPNSGVPQRKMPKGPKPPVEEQVPPIEAPRDGLTDDFLHHVAAAYRAAVRRRLRPGPELARQARVSVRTVHRWIYTARRRKIMPPGQRGRVG